MCFGPSTQGAGIRYQNTSQIQILLASHSKKKKKKKGGERYKILRLTSLKHSDAVAFGDGRKAVCDLDGGAADHKAVKCVLHDVLALRIKGAGGLIQDEYFGVLEDGACDRKALQLPARECDAPLPHGCIIPVWERANKPVPGPPYERRQQIHTGVGVRVSEYCLRKEKTSEPTNAWCTSPTPTAFARTPTPCAAAAAATTAPSLAKGCGHIILLSQSTNMPSGGLLAPATSSQAQGTGQAGDAVCTGQGSGRRGC